MVKTYETRNHNKNFSVVICVLVGHKEDTQKKKKTYFVYQNVKSKPR